MKLLVVPLISILSMMLTSFACLIPSLFIFVVVCVSVFLYFDVIAFCKRFKYSSLLRRYIFDVLSAAVKVFFDDFMSFRSLASVLWNLLSTVRNLRFFTNFINPHMHKMGPWGPKNYIFGYHFYLKTGRKLRFQVFFHFNARKHMISSFYLKWTEFKRNCEFVSNLVRVPRDPQLQHNS